MGSEMCIRDRVPLLGCDGLRASMCTVSVPSRVVGLRTRRGRLGTLVPELGLVRADASGGEVNVPGSGSMSERTRAADGSERAAASALRQYYFLFPVFSLGRTMGSHGPDAHLELKTGGRAGDARP